MRLWSFHPKYLDAIGLVALWREGLLARSALLNGGGYYHHPQLFRFKSMKNPLKNLDFYLSYVLIESRKIGYKFNENKINFIHDFDEKELKVTVGQLTYEWIHFLNKLKIRNPDRYQLNATIKEVEPNPVFVLVDGPVDKWEKVKN